MSQTKKINEQTESFEPSELSLEELESIAGGAQEDHNKRNAEDKQK